MTVKDLKNVCAVGCYLIDKKDKEIRLDFTKFIYGDIQNKYDSKEVVALFPYCVEDLYGEGPATTLIAIVEDLD